MYAYQLLPFTVAQKLTDEIAEKKARLMNGVPIEASGHYENFIKSIMGKYFAVATVNGEYMVVHKDGKGDIHLTAINNHSMKLRFVSVKFWIGSKFYSHVLDMEPPKKKNKLTGKETIAPELPVTVQQIIDRGKTHLIAHPMIFNQCTYQPGSIFEPIEPATISLWRPSPFFFYDAERLKRGHNNNFCHYMGLFRHYYIPLKMLAMNPFSPHPFIPPELEPLVAYFDLVKSVCEDNITLANWFLRLQASVIHGGIKTGCVPIFFSAEKGIGKSAVVKIYSMLVHNYHSLTGETFSKASRFFGESMNKQLVVIEELKDIKNNDAQLLEQLKNYVTNDEFCAEEKHTKRNQYKNYLNFVMTMNEVPPSLVETGDRRMVFMRSSTRVAERDSKLEKEKRTIFKMYRDILEGSGDKQFLEISDEVPVAIVVKKKEGNNICENCEKPSPEDGRKKKYLLAMLSMILFDIAMTYPFSPADPVPLTHTHIDLQHNKDHLSRLLWSFLKKKCNNYFMNAPGPWRCQVPSCPYPVSAHFDDNGKNTDWQLLHVSFERLKKEDGLKFEYKTKKKMKEIFGIDNEEHNQESYYSFPPLASLEETFRKILNLTTRVIVE